MAKWKFGQTILQLARVAAGLACFIFYNFAILKGNMCIATLFFAIQYYVLDLLYKHKYVECITLHVLSIYLYCAGGVTSSSLPLCVMSHSSIMLRLFSYVYYYSVICNTVSCLRALFNYVECITLP